MTVTYVTAASNHADNAAGFDIAADEDVVGPSINAGDLVYVAASEATTTGAITVGNDGGQTWNPLTSHEGGANGVTRGFWCRFNGTWSANPTFLPAQPNDFNDFSIIMIVFRPTNAANTWAVDVAESSTTFALPGSPFDVTITGQTAIADSGVHIATWVSTGNPTYALQTGGWSNPTNTQWRNTANNALCTSFGYKVFTAPGASGNVTNRMSSDRIGWKSIITFKEISTDVLMSQVCM